MTLVCCNLDPLCRLAVCLKHTRVCGSRVRRLGPQIMRKVKVAARHHPAAVSPSPPERVTSLPCSSPPFFLSSVFTPRWSGSFPHVSLSSFSCLPPRPLLKGQLLTLCPDPVALPSNTSCQSPVWPQRCCWNSSKLCSKTPLKFNSSAKLQ